MTLKKNWTYLTLCACLLFTACSGKEQVAGNGTPQDNNTTSAGQKNVVVAVMAADPWLKAAVRKFEELHKDIRIEIKEYRATPQGGDGTAMPAMTEGDMDKFVQTVTAQALSGDASDLIEMSNLPQDKFIEKKVLLNLNDLISKDASFDKNQYYHNILQTSQVGEGLYSIPFSFYLDRVIKANVSLLNEANITIDDSAWTWDQLKDIAKKLQSQTSSSTPTFSNMPPVQMLYDYIDANYSKLVGQGKANFDTDSFRDTMEQIKAMYDEGVMSTEYIMDESKGLFSLNGLVEPVSALMDLLRPDTQFLQMPSFDGKPGGFGYRTLQRFGINSKSKVQPEAWEFIKFLLSEEMQASPQLGGYPINKNAMDQKLEEARQMMEQGKIPVPEGQPDAETLKQTVQQLKQILESVRTKAPADFKVSAIAIEEFQSYMSGQKSAEEVSKLIQNRVTTYLNE